MSTVPQILEEMNLENGYKYKTEVAKKYAKNELFLRVLAMTEDIVAYSYGITMKNVDYKPEANFDGSVSLKDALDILEELYVTRIATGNNGISKMTELLESLSKEDAYIIERILDRDLKVRFGKTLIEKTFKGLITKPAYTRCEIGTKANIIKNMPMDKKGNFKNKVFSQVKMDGTFRRAIVDGENITITSRPGFTTEFPNIESQIRTLNADGNVFIGEMTLRGELDRKKGNGLINSDNIPFDDVVFTIWDMVPMHEFKMSKDEIKKAEKAGTLSHYEDRFEKLESLLKDNNLPNVKLIEYRVIKNMKEAYKHFQDITKAGGEGTVIKAHDMTHKDGNSKKQLKVKLTIELDVRITGFTKGTEGTKNENYFSGIEFTNDEGTIKGTVGVQTLTEDMRDWFYGRMDELVGKVITLHCNDITQAKSNDFHALSHPRYVELRTKDQTDSLERAMELKELAMELS